MPVAQEGMAHAPFVHLRNTTDYSFLRGAMTVTALVESARSEAMPAVALTDRDNVFGAMEFSQRASQAGVQPIIGCDVWLDMGRSRSRIALLVASQTGFEHLSQLISWAYLRCESHEEPHIKLSWIEETQGLLCLSGYVEGPLGQAVLEGRSAQEEAKVLGTLFPDRFYVEIQRHGLTDENRIEAEMLTLAYDLDLPLVATNDNHFTDAAMVRPHEVLRCIREGKPVSEGESEERLTPHHAFRSAAVMAEQFEDLPEAVSNTLVVAQRCAFMVEERRSILPRFHSIQGASEEEDVATLAREGLEARLEQGGIAEAKAYHTRLDHELEVITGMGFAGYFLIVADFIRWAREQGIPVGPGRGSGAGSLAAWALGITDLDPLRFGLLFERFLNPERVSLPDFDVDFCQERRDEIIEYIRTSYGKERVAQIITFGTLQARAVLRDVGRVLGLPYRRVDRICKLVPYNPAKPMKLGECLEAEPLLKKVYEEDPETGDLIDIARKLEGFYRHASTHAAGVVVGDRPLMELVPLYRDRRSESVSTQYSMKWVEASGLVKLDILGLKTLSILEEARGHVKAFHGTAIDFAALPLDDGKTLELYCSGETMGIFQVESSGMRDILRDLQPDRFEDIIALVALYRPGPMSNIPAYIKRKKGEEKVRYLHPKLEKILEETYGIPVYQEQVMQMAQTLAGFTLGHADLLRRAMGKKIKSEMAEQRQTFVAQAMVSSDISEDLGHKIFDEMDAFAGYGFNKSHAVAYALISYQTAYMKAHYPLAFWASTLSFEVDNTDKLTRLVVALRREGLQVLPPDVNTSRVRFQPEGEQIRYALGALRNVGVQAMEELVEVRSEGGDFKDIFDFVERMGSRLQRRNFEGLIKSGALDGLTPHRAQLLESVDVLLSHAGATEMERTSGQNNLFGDSPQDQHQPPLADVEMWPRRVQLEMEKESVGFYLSGHPLEGHEAVLESMGVLSMRDVSQALGSQGGLSGRVLTVAGIPVSLRQTKSRTGKRIGFLELEDATGSLEMVVFEEMLVRHDDWLRGQHPLVARIKASGQGQDGSMRFRVESLQTLEGQEGMMSGVEIVLEGEEALEPLCTLLGQTLQDDEKAGQGRVQVVLLHRAQGDVRLDLGAQFSLNMALCQALKGLPGVQAVMPRM